MVISSCLFYWFLAKYPNRISPAWSFNLTIRGVDTRLARGYDENASGWLGVRGAALAALRKVRTPESTVPGKSWSGATCWIGPQKQTATQVARVKRWCKRPPASAAMQAARQPPPGARPSRDEVCFGRREAARLP